MKQQHKPNRMQLIEPQWIFFAHCHPSPREGDIREGAFLTTSVMGLQPSGKYGTEAKVEP